MTKRTSRHPLRSLGMATFGLVAMLSPTRAEEFRLGLPIACVPGQSCWTVNYVDHDPGPGVRDYHCGALAYDGHDGTDIAIRDLAAMKNGVPVTAVAPGTVKAMRDGMPDMNLHDASPGAVAGRECGNGVLLTHEDGWETQYCHMRRGSLAVKPGDRVTSGQVLGLVGLSGKTEFPHVHLTVRHDGKTIDPFLGEEPFGACRASAGALWDKDAAAALTYRPIAIYNAGFSGAAPDPARIRQGDRDPKPAPNAEALVLWADIFGVAAGDRVVLRIIGPDGKTVATNERVMDKRYARRFEFVGRRTPAEAWPAGTYRGEIAVVRGAEKPELAVRREERVELP